MSAIVRKFGRWSGRLILIATALLAILSICFLIRSARTQDGVFLNQSKLLDQNPYRRMIRFQSQHCRLLFDYFAELYPSDADLPRVRPRFQFASGAANRLSDQNPPFNTLSYYLMPHFHADTKWQQDIEEKTFEIRIELPWWLLAVLFGIAPMIWLFLWFRRRKRKRASGCANCGYDLRAHAVGDKCPECGTPVE